MADGHDRDERIAETLALARATARLPKPRERRLIRERAGLAQQDIARALGVSRVAISRWESGDRDPNRNRLPEYVALLDRLVAESLIWPA